MKKQYSHKKENIALKKMRSYIDWNIYLMIIIFLPLLWIYHDIILNLFSKASDNFINLTTIVLTCLFVLYAISLIVTMSTIYFKKIKDKNFKQAYKFLAPKFASCKDHDQFLNKEYRKWIRKNCFFESLLCQLIIFTIIIFMIITLFIFETNNTQKIFFITLATFLSVVSLFSQSYTIYFYWKKTI